MRRCIAALAVALHFAFPSLAFAPGRTPRDTVDRLSAIMAAAVRMPDVREHFLAWGLQPTGTTAAEFAAIQKADSARWAPAVKASGISAD